MKGVCRFKATGLSRRKLGFSRNAFFAGPVSQADTQNCGSRMVDPERFISNPNSAFYVFPDPAPALGSYATENARKIGSVWNCS